jgi:hypothetical protein
VALTVEIVAVVTVLVVAVKVAEIWPAGIVREAGTDATGLELASVILTPPVGAAAVSFTVPVAELWPPTTDEGTNETALTVTGETLTDATLVTLAAVPDKVTVVELLT